jgi:hypothetical protein
MWLLQLVPDWIFHLILITGVVGLGASFVLGKSVVVIKYRIIIQVVSGILIVFGVYVQGALSNQDWWEDKVAQAELRIKEAEAKTAEANAKIEYVVVEKVKVVETVDRKLQQRIQELTAELDSNCRISPEINAIHNRAARSRQESNR